MKKFLWTEKYRPHTIADCILTSDLKATLEGMVNSGSLPSLIFNGSAGIGKTSVAYALLNELEYDIYFINGSLDNGVDKLRYDVQQFVSSLSFTGARKAVIIDEAERMTPQMQDGLKAFMEEYSDNCTFILTSNNSKKIIAPIHSRCATIEFKINKDEAKSILTQYYKRAIHILDTENVTYDKAVVAKLIAKFFPDFRRAVNELHAYSKRGPIDSGILAAIKDISINELYGFMSDKSFSNVRKWVSENIDSDVSVIFRKIFDTATDVFTPSAVPLVILTLAKYEYQAAFVVDQEINLVACLIEIMVDSEFKK